MFSALEKKINSCFLAVLLYYAHIYASLQPWNWPLPFYKFLVIFFIKNKYNANMNTSFFTE